MVYRLKEYQRAKGDFVKALSEYQNACPHHGEIENGRCPNCGKEVLHVVC